MQVYFPYSYIAGGCVKSAQNSGKSAYFSEWLVCGAEKRSHPKPRAKEISELYY